MTQQIDEEDRKPEPCPHCEGGGVSPFGTPCPFCTFVNPLLGEKGEPRPGWKPAAEGAPMEIPLYLALPGEICRVTVDGGVFVQAAWPSPVIDFLDLDRSALQALEDVAKRLRQNARRRASKHKRGKSIQ